MRRVLTGLLVVLAVVAVGGWFADGWVRARAEEEAGRAIGQRLGLASEPEVELGGFPFSLAFLTRTVPQARLSAERVPLAVSGEDLTLTGVRATAGELSLVGDEVRVSRLTATGVLGYGELGSIVGLPVSGADDGRVRLTATTTVPYGQVSVDVTGRPELDEDGRAIRFVDLELDGASASVPVPAAQLRRLVRPVPLDLPDGVELTGVRASEGGLAVAGEATGLAFEVVAPG